MAVSAVVRSTSAFGWNGDPQICAILLGNRRPEIGGDDSGYSRLSPNADEVPLSMMSTAESFRLLTRLFLGRFFT